jgi:outer membrane protein
LEIPEQTGFCIRINLLEGVQKLCRGVVPMKRIQSGIAVLCVILLIAPVAEAQVPAIQNPQGGFLSGLIHPYQAKTVPPIDLANSSRIDSLLRAGNLYLSLQDAIALALENNLDIQIQRYSRPVAEANLLRAKAGGLLRGVPSSIQASTTGALSSITGTGGGTGVGSGGGTGAGGGGGSSSSSAGGAIITQTGTAVPNLDPVFYSSAILGHRTSAQANSVTTGTNALVYRNRVWNSGISMGFLTGTTAQLGWNNSWQQSNATRTDFNPFINASLGLTITQPLLQGFGFAVNNRNIRIAKNTLKVNDLVFKQQVIQTVSAVINGYWDLVSFIENVKGKQEALDTAKKLYEDNKKQVEIGTLAPIEVTRAESEVASYQQQLVQAQTQVLQQETLLKNALSRTGVSSPSIADAHIIPTDHISVPPEEAIQPLQDLVAQALADRPELAQGSINLESSRIGLEGSKNALKPTLDIVASVNNNALAGQANLNPVLQPDGSYLIPTRNVDPFFIGGFGTTLGQLFARNFPDYSVQFQLNIPIRNRTAQADYITDQLNLRTAELQQQRLINSIRADVRNALVALQQARAGYEAAVKARELQEEVLNAEQKKYALGASTIFFVIQYQRDLSAARSTEVSAMAQYAKARTQLLQATGQTLDTYHISLDEARAGRVSTPPSALPPASQR